ncbi:hypothetical protein [Enterobacter intestinihominis]
MGWEICIRVRAQADGQAIVAGLEAKIAAADAQKKAEAEAAKKAAADAKKKA